MIKNEWKSLWENKFMLLVVIAIIAIPLIYAGLFLKSMWDPYGKVENLPVAVVNNDVPVEYEGKTLQIGDDLIDELKDNDSLAFNFVDADVAEQGLKNGTFYMVITIPEDFSENASTLMDENPKKMELTYETNPGTNYIASKMSETALTKIKDSVAAEVTKTYSETVFDQIATIGDGMQDAADGSLELKEGIEEAAKGSDTISTNLNTLANGANDLTEGTGKLEKGVKDYTDGAGKINTGAKQLSKGTKDLKKGTDTLKTKSKQYTEGVDTLAEGITAYVDGADQLAAGAKKLAALEQLGDVSEGISQLNAAVTTGSKTSPSLVSGASSLKEGIGTIQSEVSSASKTLGSLSTSMTTAANTIQAASNGIQSASSGISKAAELSNQGAQVLSAGATEISNANASIENANNAINSAIADLEQAKQDGADVDGALNTLKSLGNISKINLNTQTMQSISTGLSQCSVAVSGVPGQLEPAITGLTDGADKMAAANPASAMTALNAGLQEAYKGAAGLETGAKQVSAGLQKLEAATSSFPTAAAGITALNQGFDTLTANDAKLKEGAKALKQNTPAVSKGISDLAAGAKQLNTGASDLLAGTKELTSNNITLQSGASQLSEGAAKISDGSLKLYDGSLDLQDGMNKLQDGSKELHDAVQDGADEVKAVDTNTDTYEMFATPIEDEETKITHVENNGHAMAPYMMSVGLWVGCLAFCLVYPLMSYKGELKSGLAWWASKATVLYPVAILQGLFLITMLNKLAGFHPAEYGKTIAFACLTAVTFTSIMYFFNIWLGKIGSFLMLVFMVVQLAGSAGTYPVELSPDFVSKIHNYVPFTYTVDAFRSTICGGESIAASVKVLIALFIIFTAATIVSFHFKGVAKKKGKVLPYDWLEERGLA